MERNPCSECLFEGSRWASLGKPFIQHRDTELRTLEKLSRHNQKQACLLLYDGKHFRWPLNTSHWWDQWATGVLSEQQEPVLYPWGTACITHPRPEKDRNDPKTTTRCCTMTTVIHWMNYMPIYFHSVLYLPKRKGRLKVSDLFLSCI